MSFLGDVLKPESKETPDENAIHALAALSAVGHDSSQLVQAPDIQMDTATAARHAQDNREPAYIRHEPSTSQIRQAPESQTLKPDVAHSHITSLKLEHSSRTQSPLRESSVPVPSTETPSTTNATVPRKRPAPKSNNKKGTASTVKKEPPTKKRKPDSATKSKPKPRGITSTSAASSPGPRSVRTASSPPRSSPSAGADAGDRVSEDDDEEQGTPDPDAELYCLCRRPDTGTFMIGCDGGCDDWFHGKCVGIAERDKGLIDRYICPNCEEKDIGTTTWKRMCRRGSCRLPARVRSTKTGESSKYCSEECGILFFKGILANARQPTEITDLGPRGGLLSAGELKTLVAATPNLDEFKRLGDGVLSPPTTLPSQDEPNDPSASHYESGLNDIEHERIEHILQTKETTRARHALLKDRTKFITMLKQSATRLAEDRNAKPKDLCGYDDRVTWTEAQFSTWRASPEGMDALKSSTLHPASVADVDGDTNMTADTAIAEPCMRRKCAKHYDWAKLQLDDTRFEISENSEVMRALDKEEKDIRTRASLRAREIRSGGLGGTVELHDSSFLKGDAEVEVVEDVVVETRVDAEAETEEPPADVELVLDAMAQIEEVAEVKPELETEEPAKVEPVLDAKVEAEIKSTDEPTQKQEPSASAIAESEVKEATDTSPKEDDATMIDVAVA